MMLLALNKDTGQKVSISQAEKDCHYNCILCKSKVIPVKGEVKTRHFRHARGKQAGYKSGETPLHLYAKRFLLKHRMLYLPDGRVQVFDSVHVERAYNGKLRIDATGYCGRRTYLIEFAVTHEVDREKLEILKSHNVDVVEVDLSSWRKPCPTQASPAAFHDIVFEMAPRRWLQRRRTFPRLYRWFELILERFMPRRNSRGQQPYEPVQLPLQLYYS
ncbi:hypothetical protein J6I75_04780 [Pseudidiomarina sp. 1APP75-27a]|uniref:hypothetical protein n=1 Tax=Pseudidiomarina terrestris TaxID=2820060 RepID=UPI002B057B3F|nr:hypothetical protein [Pseudidiomarina sp. 1APP75-27a]MEA3587659.1 hypothetical protein [Pseudidiomarina sp. 1APP75-27a]